MRDWYTAVCGICSCSVVANRLPWAAWETGIQLCVQSVAVQLWQTDCHGLHERLPWLVQHSCFIRTQITLVIHQRQEKHSSYSMVQWTGHPASKSVFSNRRHCPLSACSPTMWLQDYTEGTKVTLLMTVLYWLIKNTTMTTVMFLNTWHKGMILHWPL